MGSIHKEGEVWIVRHRIEGKQKKFRPGPAGFPNSQKGARAFLAALETSLNTGTYTEPAKETFGAYAERWLKSHAKNNTSPKTFESYQCFVRAYLVPGLGDTPMSKLAPAGIAEFYAELKAVSGKPLAASSRKTIHQVLNAILNYAVEMEVIPRNPIKKAIVPKSGKHRTDFYSTEEIRRMLELAEGHPMQVPVSLSIYTGMRIGEVCALRWEDVDLDRKLITICRSMEQTDAGLREKPPKSGTGRTVEIGDKLVEALLREKGSQAQRRLSGSIPANASRVVLNLGGGQHAPEYLGERWNAFITGTGLPIYCFHTLRHTHASMLIEAGVHVKVISTRLGHSNISMTMDTYGHLMKGVGEQAASLLDAAVG